MTIAPDGRLVRLASSGHAVVDAGRGRGTAFSAACLGVSLLLRTFGRLVVERVQSGLLNAAIDGSVVQPGEFDMTVRPAAEDRWYSGVADVVVRGLTDLHEAFVDEIDLQIREE